MRPWFLVGIPFCLAVSTLHSASLAPLTPRGDLEAWHVGSVASGFGPAAAWWNPALLGIKQDQTQLEFIWSGEGEDHPQQKELGFFTQMGGLGFGMLHQESASGDLFVNKYRVGLGSGGRGHYTGMAYAWSVGNVDSLKEPDQFVVSSLNQPHRYVSIGYSGTFALGKNYQQSPYLIEAGLALRPFTDRVSVSLDGAWRTDRKEYEKNSGRYWVGVEVEPLDYLRLSARQSVQIFGAPETDKNWSLQAGVYLRHFGFSTLQPQPENDNVDAGARYSLLLSDRTFNRGLELSHKKHLFARINLEGQAGEYPWLIYGQKFRLMSFFKQMKEAEKNPRLKGLFINIKPSFTADMVLLGEIRNRILEYKKNTGGEVAIYCHRHSLATLYLASVADRRAMLPIGEAQIGNFGRESVYLADALDEAGIDFIRYNIGAYKGFGEDLDKNAMSPEVRENVGRAFKDLYSHVTGKIREGYGFNQARMDSILSRWFLSKNELLAFGLVDTLLYDDQVEDWVCRRAPDDEDDEETKQAGSFTISLGFSSKNLKKLNEDKVISLGSQVDRPVQRRWGEMPEIAVIYASGPIYSGRSIGPLVIGDETVVKQLEAVRKDDNVKAVVFHIDSPGGSGYASDLIWREMERLKKKKPLIVTQGYLAASGGYYLSMAADTILSTPTTITGSIGVAAGIFVDKGLMNNARLRQDGVWAGKKESLGGAPVMASLSIDAGSAQYKLPTLPVMGRNLTEYQSLELQAMIRDFYTDFVQKAADGRGRSWDDIDAIAEGRIWSGSAALENGLVDGMGGLRDAIEIARQKAGLKESDMALKEIHPGFSFADLMSLIPLLAQGGGMNTAQQRLFEQHVGLAQDLNYKILGSGKPEMLMEAEPFEGLGW